jgi:hypothetical protein
MRFAFLFIAGCVVVITMSPSYLILYPKISPHAIVRY